MKEERGLSGRSHESEKNGEEEIDPQRKRGRGRRHILFSAKERKERGNSARLHFTGRRKAGISERGERIVRKSSPLSHSKRRKEKGRLVFSREEKNDQKREIKRSPSPT